MTEPEPSDEIQSEPQGEPNARKRDRLTKSIRPGKPVSETILVARLNVGSYVLQAWPQLEPGALLCGQDAEEFHDALTRVFHPIFG